MQQLGVGATLNEHGHNIEKFISQDISGFYYTRKHKAAANLVCNDVQLYDTSRSGSGLLADDVEHLAHEFLNQETQKYWLVSAGVVMK